jgi:hypothetical protein
MKELYLGTNIVTMVKGKKVKLSLYLSSIMA